MSAMKWLSWLCIGLLATGLSLTMTACEDDGGDDSETTTAVVTNTVTGAIHTNTVVTTNAPTPTPTPTPTTQVLLDISRGVGGGEGFGVFTEATPSAGTVKIEASWVAIDLIAGGAPIDIPLEFLVNDGVAGAGSFHNAGHPSPFSGSVGMPASLNCKIQVYNNVSDSMATIHLRAIFTPD